MKKITQHNHIRQRGFALLLAIIIASVVLAIGVAILKISVSQLQLSATGRESEVSFQASQAMTECLTFWRFNKENEFTARPGSALVGTYLNAPAIECMDGTLYESFARVEANDDGEIHVVKFHYTFDWGDDPKLCSSGQLNMIVPYAGEQRFLVDGTSAGDDGDGWVDCRAGTVCTVLLTQGYNRPCDQLRSSIFTVQREITSEF